MNGGLNCKYSNGGKQKASRKGALFENNVIYLFNVRRELFTAGAFFESYAFLYSSIMLFVVLRRMRSRWICVILWMSGVDAREFIDELNGDEAAVDSKYLYTLCMYAQARTSVK